MQPADFMRFHLSPPILVFIQGALNAGLDVAKIEHGRRGDPCIVVIVVAIHCIFARNTRARSGLLSRFQVESPMIPSNFLVVPMITTVVVPGVSGFCSGARRLRLLQWRQ